MFKYIVDGKKVSYDHYNIVKIMKDRCSKEKKCDNCDLTDLCTGYNGIPSIAELSIELEKGDKYEPRR